MKVIKRTMIYPVMGLALAKKVSIYPCISRIVGELIILPTALEHDISYIDDWESPCLSPSSFDDWTEAIPGHDEADSESDGGVPLDDSVFAKV
jgi:hypothetical protein